MTSVLLSAPFISGSAASKEFPLFRYLPPLPNGVAAAWLADRIPPGGWVLDPFGASPSLTSEMARHGYRVFVAANNPVMAFIIEMLAEPPLSEDLTAALAALASAPLRDTRIEPHIQSLYQTICRKCGSATHAEAFLWEKEAHTPYGVIYTCTHCHASGEYPTSEADVQRALQYSGSGLHRAKALERVAPPSDPDRGFAEEALDVYPARAVYALGTLINKLQGLALSPQQQTCLTALLLHAFDKANTLWPHPVERERPRQLTIPPKYRENNIWLALEEALTIWKISQAPFRLTVWPELPPESGGVCILEGRYIEFARQIHQHPIAAVLTALPRPNQAFWTLSALWSGWLWGAGAVDEFKSVLRRQRYSWRWHTAALHATFSSLKESLPRPIPIWSLIGESEAGYLTAAISAAHCAGLTLESVAMRPESGQTQLTFSLEKQPLAHTPALRQAIQNSAQTYLQTRGEPSRYLPVLAAALHTVTAQPVPETLPEDTFNIIQQSLESKLSLRGGFTRLEASGKSPEVGYWWLADHIPERPPLADEVEMACVRYLLNNPGCSSHDLDNAICEAFPGLLTPHAQLISACLESYGEQGAAESDQWYLRPQDAPAERRSNLQHMAQQLESLGNKLDLRSEPLDETTRRYIWRDLRGEILYRFYLTASAVLGKIVYHQEKTAGKGVIILPGGRANLVACKLHLNPVLRKEVEKNWQFIKFRHLRYLADHPSLTLTSLNEQIALDPLTYSEPQIRLF